MTKSDLKNEVRFLTTRLGEMIREQEGDTVYNTVEAIRQASKAVREKHDYTDIERKQQLIDALDPQAAYAVIHAFSLFFQLVNNLHFSIVNWTVSSQLPYFVHYNS